MNKIKNESGITLIALTVTIVVMMILIIGISAVMTTNIEIENYNKVKEDIVALTEAVKLYYLQNNKLPIVETPTISRLNIPTKDINPNDNNRYYYIDKSLLTDVQLTIQKGESIAFIGASGAGKTTLSDIILGLLQPEKGTVDMDGIDVYTIPMQWAHIVGYVPQSIFLMDDTVRNNIAFGISAETIEDKYIWEALEKAQLKDFVEKLPYGLDTIVGERGVKFSGGQRQRVAIARALYNKPEILVLDEATAALDNETETAVMESIDALQGQITMIIVAHRLTTIRNCDKIYEIKDGVAVERSKEEVFG